MERVFNYEETDKVREALKKKELYFDEVAVYTEGPHLYAVIDIEWGDWKHDHLYCDYLMKQLGYLVLGATVTEEDGSDCYSAVRRYLKSLL